jgi:HEAT repeat protein
MVSKRVKKSNVLVHDTIEPARNEATVASDIPAEKSVEQLIQELLKGPDEIVRSHAAGALGHRKSEKAVGSLILP